MLSLGVRGIIGKYIKNRILKTREITEEEIKPILREIRIALLNSDVNLDVIRDFLKEIKDELLIEKNYNPSDNTDVVVFSTIKRKLIKVLGESATEITFNPNKLNKVLVIGLNGSGKTTTTAKLSNHIKKKHSIKVKNVSLDIYRPGAYDQLKQLSDSVGIPCVGTSDKNGFKETIKNQISSSSDEGVQFIFFDNYGLFPDNDALLEEVIQIKKLINPTEVLFVLDAMSGQEILDVAKLFHERIGINGLVISKTDSNAPMGGVFSISYLLKIPIKYMGKGEGIDDLDRFYPERIASLILGEGDILSLAEKIETSVDADSSKKLITKMMSGNFDLNDLITQIKTVKKMGSLKSLLKMLPGLPFDTSSVDMDSVEGYLKTWEVMISSMTLKERKNPKLFKKQPNRKIRVIKGSGKKPDELNKLLKKWEEMSTSLKKNKNIFKFPMRF